MSEGVSLLSTMSKGVSTMAGALGPALRASARLRRLVPASLMSHRPEGFDMQDIT